MAGDAHIRGFRPEDIAAVGQILRQSPGAALWSSGGQENLLAQPGTIAFVLETGPAITGFVIARQADDEAEILNIAVAPQSRRAGQGTALLQAVFHELQRRHVIRFFLEVRDSNAPAIAFYCKYGFAPVGRRKAYYRDPPEDAVVMEKKLTT